MKLMVRFLPEALEDLFETQRWYAIREPALGQTFAGAIAAAVERIAQDPATFPCDYGAVRRPPWRPLGPDGWPHHLLAAPWDHASARIFILCPMTRDHPVKRRKKLIEAAIPLEAINAASARERSIRHGHPSSLHQWSARRPLAGRGPH